MTYPTIRPELTLDFANSRQLDPRITFSRTSGATYLNPDTGLITLASEHEPRFEKDGLLIEQRRTNTFLNSNDCALWGSFRATVGTDTGVITAPDGSNAVGWFENSIGSKGSKVRGGTVVDGTVPSSMFVWLKARSGSPWVAVGPGQPGTNKANVFFNLSTGEQGQRGSALVGDVDIIPFPNGWYKIVFTGVTPVDLATSLSVWAADYDGQANEDYTILSSYYCWGAQVEDAVPYPTSYIPTAGQTGGVTRDADIFQIAGDNFSSWYNPIKSTMVVNMSCKRSTGYGILWGFYGGGGRIEGYPGEGTPFAGLIFFYGDNNTQKYIGRGNADGEAVWNQEHKIEKCAYSWDFSSGEGTACISGNFAPISPPDTGVPMTTVTGGFRLMGGQNPSNVTNSGIVSSVAYYPQRLSDLELQTITL